MTFGRRSSRAPAKSVFEHFVFQKVCLPKGFFVSNQTEYCFLRRFFFFAAHRSRKRVEKEPKTLPPKPPPSRKRPPREAGAHKTKKKKNQKTEGENPPEGNQL